ncbi:hypothetical protein [Vannielia sp.]|uniref:hypothetical protein n=1 Tax=Vannielia sp. TaxID=2813045 RepID=UPI0026280420|nr:hypothetical protein [Vannielia sp.]MDF1873971.1 hypothetical protein [Vannielia sp.]
MQLKPLRALSVAALLLAGCSPEADLLEPAQPIGAFKLGYSVVHAEDARLIPPSRGATAQEWQDALDAALTRRFSRLNGDQLYHIAVKVDGYSLAIPGVPVVLSPKSVLSIGVTVWDDATQSKLNPEPRRFTVFERLSGETLIGSGLTQSRETQMANLSANAARLIEGWMRENPAWFAAREMAPETMLDAPEAVSETVLDAPATAPATAPPGVAGAPGVSPDITEVITPAQ